MTNERQSNAFSIRNHQSITENTGTSSALKIEKKTHQFLWSKCTFCMLCALYVCQSMAFPYRIPSNEGQIVQSNTIFCPVNFVICTWSIKYDCFHGRNKNVNYFGSQIYLHSIAHTHKLLQNY